MNQELATAVSAARAMTRVVAKLNLILKRYYDAVYPSDVMLMKFVGDGIKWDGMKVNKWTASKQQRMRASGLRQAPSVNPVT